MPFPKPTPRPKRVRGPIPRRRRPSPVRRTPRAAQERKLDALWGRHIMRPLADGPKLCAACLRRRATDPAHVLSRRHKAVRWHPDNGRALCRECHDYYTAHPDIWEAWVDVWWPGTLAMLRRLARTIGRVDLAAAERELRA